MIKLSVYVKPCLAANSINALRIKRLTSGQIKGGADWKARGGNKVTVRSGGPGRVGNKIRMRCENSREPGESFLFAIYSPWRAEGAADFELGCYLRVDCQSRDAPLQSRSLGSRCTGTACTLSANKMWKKRKGKKEYRIYTYIYTSRRHLQRYLALLSFAWRARPGVRFIFPIRLSSLASPDFSRPLPSREYYLTALRGNAAGLKFVQFLEPGRNKSSFEFVKRVAKFRFEKRDGGLIENIGSCMSILIYMYMVK